MARTVKRGTGMMEQTVTLKGQGDFATRDDFANAFFEALEANCIPDNVREDNARRCEAILVASGFPEVDGKRDYLSLAKLPDHHAARIAVDWLAEYRRLDHFRRRIADGEVTEEVIQGLIISAEEIGRLHERMYWRSGLVTTVGNTKKRREELAMGKLRQERSTKSAAAARRQQAEDVRPDWHELAVVRACELRSKNQKRTRWNIAGELREEFRVSHSRVDAILKKMGFV